MASSGSLWVSLGLKTDQFTKGIAVAKGQLNGFQKFGAGMKSMFNPLTIGIAAFAAIGAGIADAIGTINAFEKANSELEAVLNGTVAEMASLSKQAKELGATTAFTATEVAGLQKEFAKLGFDSSQIQNMTEATLNLAAAAGTELAEAASVAGGVINAFGLNSQDAAHVTDVMAASFAQSGLDMEKFTESMKNAAPIARATGSSLEETTAALGILANNSISGAKAGTDLRKIFSELVKDGKPFKESLDDIAKAMDEANTPAEKLAIAEDLVGERAKGALLIMVDQRKELGELGTAFEKVDDDAKRMADTMLNNVQGSMTKAASAYEGFILSVEDGSGAISTSSQMAIDKFTNILSFLTKLNSGAMSWGDIGRQAANIYITAITSILIPFKALAAVIDKMTGSNLSKLLDWTTPFELVGDKVDKFEEGLRKLNQTAFTGASAVSKLTKKYMSLGLSESEAIVKSRAMIKEMKITAEVMPAVKDGVDGVTGSVKKLTAAEKEQLALKRELIAEYGNLERVAPKTAAGLDLIGRSTNAIKENIARLTAELNKAEIGSGAFTALQTKIEELQLSLDGKKLHLSILPKLEPIPEDQMEALAIQEAQIDAIAKGMAGGVTSAFSSMSDGMMESIDETDDAMGRFTKTLKNNVLKLIATNMASAMSNAITGATASGAASGPAAAFTTPAFIASAVAGIIGAFAAIPKFADGGIVSGATMGMMGEYSGAKNNPEVIAPLDKLRGMLGGGNQDINITGELVLSGNQLVAALRQENKRNHFSN